MSYQLYRSTTLGNCLQETLDELISQQAISPQVAIRVLLEFDKSINQALNQRTRNRINFKGELNTYRFCDNVWTFLVKNGDFVDGMNKVRCDKVKIVACDGKNPNAQPSTGTSH